MDKVAQQRLIESLGMDEAAIERSVLRHLKYTIAKDPTTVTPRDWFFVLAHTVRDRLAERWAETTRQCYQKDCKRVYYLSLEFLLGRTLINAVLNLGMYEPCCRVLDKLGVSRSLMCEMESDPALGNGGLGRLAACFLDSMATLGLPGYGYGIRYEYGMFYQRLNDGWQHESPDNWLRYGNPWEFPRAEVLYPVPFGGKVVQYTDAEGQTRFNWEGAETVMAMAYDTPIPGYHNDVALNLRLWSAKASRDFHFHYFNEGDYRKAVEEKNNSENLSKVLYPNDSTYEGKKLRLRQEFFFVSASLQDILRRHSSTNPDFSNLADKVVIQLNDTHPALAIPELLRHLLDFYHLSWDEAWDITTSTFAYTNHTLMPEALETWPLALLEELLPRHLQIIYEINHRFLKQVSYRYPGDTERLRRMSLIGEEGAKSIRMGHLAVVGSHKVNGVAALHTELMKDTIFADFHDFFPDKIINKTNGVTPRRWLNEANPDLADLISTHIGENWHVQLEELQQLQAFAEEAGFQAGFAAVKRANKHNLADFIQRTQGININPDSLFDVQVKRIHEYKRQLLNVLHVITLYNELRDNPQHQRVPRTVIFAGKAAPGYEVAKLIIKLINDVAELINNDPQIGNQLKVVFLPNYDVSNAERIIPAADLSEQISTAGTEASGTGNMKLALNGALTIGTLDGANIEIRDRVGHDNMFIFGLTAMEVADLRTRGYNPWDYYHANQELRRVLDMIGGGYFCPEQPDRFKPLVERLTHGGDHYLLLADYASYVACQRQIDKVYQDRAQWLAKAILNVANMGWFSSDRTIEEYAKEIWQVKKLRSNNDEVSV